MWILYAALGALIVLGIVLLIRSEWERNHPVTAPYEVSSPLIPKEASGFRILFLADLHGKMFPEENEALLRILRETPYDLVLIGGDMMTTFRSAKKDRRALESLLSGIPEGIPVLYGLGNHEQHMLRRTEKSPDWEKAFRQILKEHDVRLVADETVSFAVPGGEIRIAGAGLPPEMYRAGRKKPLPEGFLETALGEKDPAHFTVLLLHSPLYLDEAAEWGADLTLAGHFHGGTIRLFGRGLMTPQYQFFYPRCQGMFSFGDKKGIVSAGLGTHSVNVRLFDRPEAVLVTFKHEDKAN